MEHGKPIEAAQPDLESVVIRTRWMSEFGWLRELAENIDQMTVGEVDKLGNEAASLLRKCRAALRKRGVEEAHLPRL